MKIFKAFGFIFLIFLALEAGLQLKGHFKKSSLNDNTSSGHINVLIIADSVIGNAGEPDSVFSHLQNRLVKNNVMNINLIDASSKANYSAQANFEADELIKKYNPALSIVLLGGSDFIDAKLETSSPLVNSVNLLRNIFYKTYLYKLTISLGLQLKTSFRKNFEKTTAERRPRSIEAFNQQEEMYKRFLKNELDCSQLSKLADARIQFTKDAGSEILSKAQVCADKMAADEKQAWAYFYIGRSFRILKNSEQAKIYYNKSLIHHPRPEQIYAVLFWLEQEKMNCPQMFINFENVLKTIEPDRRMLWMLRRCFAEYNRASEGAAFFAALAPKLKDTKNLSLLMSQSLVPGNQVDIKSIAPGENEYYISRLQSFKTEGKNKEANELYLNKDLYLENDLFQIDHKNYRELLRKLTANHRKVLVLQYANQSDWPVLEAIAPLDGDITFLSLGSVFEKNLEQYNVLDLFTEDFVHLAVTGTKVVAEELEKAIYMQLKKE